MNQFQVNRSTPVADSVSVTFLVPVKEHLFSRETVEEAGVILGCSHHDEEGLAQALLAVAARV